MLARTRAVSTLIRWLGPWAGQSMPTTVSRSAETIRGGGRPMRAYVYRPTDRPALGAYVIAPGLHFLGPDDVRLDRFARVLSACGLLVLAPFLPDHTALRVHETSTDDLARAYDRLERETEAHDLPRPALFSISFGSQPAIALAARPSHRGRVQALVLFGGFADFEATVRYSIHGGEGVAHDPLNAPVVWLHLLDRLDTGAPFDRDAVERAWRTMVTRTWGRMELKKRGARDPIAHEIAASLDEVERALFLMGCGLGQGAADHLDRGLAATAEAYAFTDPRPHLARLHAPLVIVHGRDDDVIPYREAEKLRAALPSDHPHRVLITGMYGHTGASIPSPRALATELATMLGVVQAIVDAPLGRLSR